MSPVTGSRARPVWSALPDGVRTAVEQRLGAPVVGWTSHDGGYSPGLASTLRTADGKAFVKAVDTAHEVAARLYRTEADVVPGRTPGPPWNLRDVDAVGELALRIAEIEVQPGVLPEIADELPTGAASLAADRPAGLGTFDPWLAANLDRLAELEAAAPQAVRGSTLVHGDLRGDNAVVTHEVDRVVATAVDWPYANRGAAFCDLVGLVQSVTAEGGPTPEQQLERHRRRRRVRLPGLPRRILRSQRPATPGPGDPAPPQVPAHPGRGLPRLVAPTSGRMRPDTGAVGCTERPMCAH